MKDLLRIADLTQDDLVHLIELADRCKREPALRHDVLDGRVVVLGFRSPSAATRLLFEAAVAGLGGVPSVVTAAELELGGPDAAEDTAHVISEYAAALVVGIPADDEVRRIASRTSIPVLNALADLDDPCRTVAELLTIRQRVHHFVGHKIAYVGDGNGLAHGLLEGAALMGADVSVASPPQYSPPADVLERAEQLAVVSGSWIEIGADPHVAVKDADIVCTDIWRSMDAGDDERAERARVMDPYRVTAALLDEAGPGVRFMHALPADRGYEVAAEVIDGPRSLVFELVTNRLPAVKAILASVVQRELHGS